MTAGPSPRVRTAPPRWFGRVVLAACALVLSVSYLWPAFRDPEATGFGDWQMVHHNWETAYVALTRYGEVARYDPFHCGGVSAVGNPENGTLAPTYFALALPFGPTAGSKLFIALHLAFGFASAFTYLRRLADVPHGAAAAGAALFAGSGFFAWHLAGGHATFAPFAFLPAIALALREGETHPARALVAGALFALALVEGGTYPVPYMAVDVAVITYARAVLSPPAGLRALRAVAIAALSALALSAYRLGPVLATLRRLPRTIGSVDSSQPSELLTFFTARTHDWHVPGHEFVWPEYGTYVGYPALVLACLGALTVARRGHRTLPTLHLVGLGVACALALGNSGEFHPWPLLRALPVFDSLRVPSRFLVVASFHLAVLAALGLAQLGQLVGGRRHPRVAHGVVWALALGVAVDLAVVTRPIVDRWDGAPIDATQRAHVRVVRAGRPYDTTVASNPRRNESTVACYVGAMNWPVSPALRVGDVPQVFDVAAAARPRLTGQTVNTTRFEVHLGRPSTIAVNLNYDPAFVASAGQVVDHAGLLAVALPAGHHRVVVRHDATPFLPHLALSAATAGALVVFGFVRARRRGRTA